MTDEPKPAFLYVPSKPPPEPMRSLWPLFGMAFALWALIIGLGWWAFA